MLRLMCMRRYSSFSLKIVNIVQKVIFVPPVKDYVTAQDLMK